MYKILTVIGARPQFIKAAAISKVIIEREDVFEVLVHTGQHYDKNMSAVFFEEMGLPKEKYNLNVGSGTHAKMTSEIMIQLEDILIQENPDCVLLYGDTNSTMAAAITASKIHIPVVHVEAGIRSKRKNRPEELNRIITDHLSSILFPPTKEGEINLKNEGVFYNPSKRVSNDNPLVHNFGDVMYDNFIRFKSLLGKRKGILSNLNLTEKKYVLLTIHRALNTDNHSKLTKILTAVNTLSLKENIKIIFPIHPRTKKQLDADELKEVKEMMHQNNNIVLCDPVSFIDMMILQDNCKLIITDSGGIQKEAAFFEKKCIVLLESTPWKELVSSGVLIELTL